MRRVFVRLAVVALASAAVPLLAFAPRWASVGFVVTPSMPRGIYRLSPAGEIQRGSIVVVCLPQRIAEAMLERGYVSASTACARSHAEPLYKRVAAVEGDDVDVRDDGVYVDGRELPGSRPLRHDGAGRAMPTLREHVHIHHGELWLYTPVPVSYDSRYFGPIATSDVVALAAPLITE